MSSGRKSCKLAIVLATGLNGLGVIRSLGAVGIESIVIVNSNKDLPFYSRLPRRQYIIPSDASWEENALSLISSLDLGERVPVVACSDRAANFLANYKDALSTYCHLLIPDNNVIQAMNDKREEVELMLEHDIPVPYSITRISADAANILTFPAIIKPRTFENYKTLNAKNLIVNNKSDWHEFLAQYAEKLDEFIAQNVIAGDDVNLWVCNATFDKHSDMICAFSFRRLGTSPSHFGVTSLAKSEINPRVVELSEKVGKALNYIGPAMFEFKYDQQTQDYLYIETNPRLGMCNWFDTQCGINNVAASCYAAGDYEQQVEQTQQIENQYFWSVVSDFIARLEDRENIGSILKLYSTLIFKKKIWAIHFWGDLKPSFCVAADDLKMFLSRVVGFLWKKIGLSSRLSSEKDK